MTASKPAHVLDGYKVLDFTQALAGPTVTRLMAELGADVIKPETPPKGDFSRAFPFLKDGRSAYYVQQNRGKKSLCLDPKKPEGLAIIKQLLPTMDVLIENYSPGTIARMGLGSAAAPHALDIEPGRAVPADTLVKNAIAEMRDLKVGDESKLRIWQAEMRKIIPNVKPSDQIVIFCPDDK